jgi:cobalt-zinc-cadmium efflux system protein
LLESRGLRALRASMEEEGTMAHDHGHGGHSHAPANFGKAFAIGIALNLGFVIAEVIYGRLAHSIALIADAGHNMSDVLGLALAFGASVLARRRPTQRHTYGFRRTSILAALTNAIVLLIVTGGIAWEAVRRFNHPDDVAGRTVMVIAAIGIAVNGVTALLFMSGRKDDLNIRGAFTHMAADAGVAAGVVVTGLLILLTGRRWLDPVASLAISAIIVVGTWGLLRDSFNLALDAVPEGVDMAALQGYLANLPAVTEVHDLHVWGMSTTETALTAHLVIPDAAFTDERLSQVCGELHDRFGIEHATLQIEQGDPAHPCSCSLATASHV